MTTFADLHRGPRPLLLPDAWDVASAVLLADAGAVAVGTTSLGITAAAGLPDGAGEGRALTVALARALVPRLPVPLTVDLEGGYDPDPGSTSRTGAPTARCVLPPRTPASWGPRRRPACCQRPHRRLLGGRRRCFYRAELEAAVQAFRTGTGPPPGAVTYDAVQHAVR